MASSYESLLQWFKNKGDQDLLDWTWKGMIASGLVMILLSEVIKLRLPYGRYGKSGLACNMYLSARKAWVLQELPSVVVPLFLLFNIGGTQLVGDLVSPNIILVGMFLLHYVQRTFLFSLCIRGGKPTPVLIFFFGITFTTVNGYLQARYLIEYYTYEFSWFYDPRFMLGHLMFLLGMAININSDSILRSLRKPGETGYKIPKGGVFELVSGANYFGETLEWWGFAISSWSLPAFSFAFFTTCMLGTRALQHHRYYLEKFEDYPKSRKAFIPYLF